MLEENFPLIHELFGDCMFILFQEADNWTTLSADVEEVFSTRDVDKVSFSTIEWLR